MSFAGQPGPRRGGAPTLLGFVLLVLSASVCIAAETRIALVIGNGAYPSGPLASPKDDAEAVEAKLKALGFQVTRKADLGREGFFNAIRDFGDRLQQPGTVGLFYYSGHGMQVNNRNYMIPTDAGIHSEVDVERYAVPVEDILARMELGKSDLNIVILDASRNNPFERQFKSLQQGLAQIDAPARTLIAFAAAPGRVAESGLAGKLSLYTEALVAHIDRPYPDFVSMFQAVQNAVYERSAHKQSPRLELAPGLPAFSFTPAVISSNTLKQAIEVAENRVALVIGNAVYPTAPLSNPPNDAHAMQQILIKLAFNVTKRVDVGRKEMRTLIRQFGERLQRPDTVALFFYSGHGSQVDGHNYMIPVDADISSATDIESDGVSVWVVLQTMAASNSRVNIVVLDACRDNVYQKSSKTISKGLGRMEAPNGTLIAYATAPGAVADNGPAGGYSPFTAALINAIVTPDISALEMFNDVSTEVYIRSRTQQRPQRPYIEVTTLPRFMFNPSSIASPRLQPR